MKIHDTADGRLTVRQWAKKGFLLAEGANGVEMWENPYCQDSYIYYSQDEVREATPEELKEFFRPERERRNAAQRKRREVVRAERKLEAEREREAERQEIVYTAIKPYVKRILELQRIIKNISAENAPPCGNKTIIIDTETTGLDPETDELLQVSIIDSDGNTLFDSYFKPTLHTSWREAERINGITPEMVKDAPSIADKISDINVIMLQTKKIVGYNVNFDLDFLNVNGLMLPRDVPIVDCMKEFAEEYGEYSDYFEDYKWQKLTTAANYYGYDWNSRPESAHNSLADCYATLHVYNNLCKE